MVSSFLSDEEFLTKSGVIIPVHFEGKSGLHGDKYVEKDIFCAHIPMLFERLTWCEKLRGLTQHIGKIDIVVGPQAAGTVFGALVALRLNVPLVYAEKDGKCFKLRETFVRSVKGKRILLVDDVLNMAATSAPIVQMLHGHGATVVGAYFIVDRGNVSAADIGVPTYASMFYVKLPMWKPGKGYCPQCDAGVSLSLEYGHAGKKKNG